MEEVFLIKDVTNNKFYIEDWRQNKNWTLDFEEATIYHTYVAASEELHSSENIPEGMYQIEKIFKKPELEYEEH